MRVAEAKRTTLADGFSYSGTVVARRQVALVPKVGGRVVKVHVDVGSAVEAGQTLVELDRDAAAAQVAQAEAGLAAARARLAGMEAGPRVEQVAQAEANLRAAEARLAQLLAGPTPEQLAVAEAQVRLAKNQEYLTQENVEELSARTNQGTSHSPMVPLFSKDIGRAQSGVAWEQTKIAEANLAALKAGPTAEQVAQAEAAVEVARQQLSLAKQPVTEHDLAAARAAVAQAQAAVDLAKVQLAEATVVAPFAGVVAQRLVAEGAMAGPTTPLLSLVSGEVEVAINVDEATAASLKAGDEAVVTAGALGGKTFAATVRVVAPTVDAKTRMVQVLLLPAGGEGGLRDGMFVEVQLSGAAAKREALVVPSGAVIREDGALVVYVVDGGKAQRRVVTTGAADGDLLEITSGLAAGEQVAVSGLTALSDGQEVVVQ